MDVQEIADEVRAVLAKVDAFIETTDLPRPQLNAIVNGRTQASYLLTALRRAGAEVAAAEARAALPAPLADFDRQQLEAGIRNGWLPEGATLADLQAYRAQLQERQQRVVAKGSISRQMATTSKLRTGAE